MCVGPLTPFKDDYNRELDLDKIKEYVDHLVSYKATSVFITGTISEGNSLTVEERKKVMDAWMEHCKGKLLVIHHIGAGSLKDSQELARYAEKIGAEVIAAVAPTYYKPRNEEDYVEYMQHVAEAAPNTPFYLYDIDFVTGIHLDLGKFFELAKDRIPTLVGVKHTSKSLVSMNKIKLIGGGDMFQVLMGGDETYLEGLAIGIDVPVVAQHAVPTLVKIREAFHKGDLETARKLQSRLVQASEIRRKYPYGLAPMTKAMMRTLGLDLGPPRLPMNKVPENVYNSLKKDLTDIGFFDWVKP